MSLNQFRVISVVEGLSLVILLFIAVPLKYQMGMPIVVKIVGPIHGVLWLLYIVASLATSHKAKWSVLFWLLSLILSVIPFGFLLLEFLLKKSDQNNNQVPEI